MGFCHQVITRYALDNTSLSGFIAKSDPREGNRPTDTTEGTYDRGEGRWIVKKTKELAIATDMAFYCHGVVCLMTSL